MPLELRLLSQDDANVLQRVADNVLQSCTYAFKPSSASR